MATQQLQFGRAIHAPVLFLAYIHHIAHARESFALQLTPLAVFQFGQHLVHHLNVVGIPGAVGDAEGVHIGVSHQIFEFVLLVVGVDSYKDSPNLGAGVHIGQPFRNVLCPDAYMVSFFDSNGHKSERSFVDPLVEGFPGEAQISVGINNVFLVGGNGGPVFQPVAQCSFYQLHDVGLIRGINYSQNPSPGGIGGVYVVVDDGIVVNTFALSELIGFLAVRNLNGSLQHIDELFTFV
ncbi:MAG: hypothetical protein BWY72_02189 [Bacteroidetes bacterium ADurb.Bin416]|nr:MAG: hypothetical protein BWY72_02189 [Bacteroidetes bacterium ADurb.Bin416]